MRRETTREVLERRSFGRCERCGAGRGTEVHHRQFRSRGGRDGFANVVLVCGWGNHTGCHGWAHSEAEAATAAGFAVPSWAEPAETPIYLAPWKLWALLDDDGSFVFTDDQPPAPP